MAKDRFGGDVAEETGGTDRFGGSLVEQIPSQKPEYLEAARNSPEEMRIRNQPFYQGALEAIGAVPITAGLGKLAQFATRGSARLAPYGQRAAEVFIPSTGKELAKLTGLTAIGGSAAQTATNMLPPDANPLVRFGVETGAAIGAEGLTRSLATAGRAFRPLLPGGTSRAAERVVRDMTPEQIAALPQTVESKNALVRAAQERLRGKPVNEPLDASEIASLLNIESVAGRRRGEELASSLLAGTESRLAQISQPRTMEAVGADARKLAADRLKVLRDAREKATDTNKQAMLDDARRQEAAGVGIESTQAFKDATAALKAFERSPQGRALLTSDSKPQFDKLRRELMGISFDPMTGETKKELVGFERLERLRRQLGDRAAGLPETGYDAIGQKDAKDLKKLVENVMEEFTGGKTGKFRKYVSEYETLSQPINKFGTDAGQVLTAPSATVRDRYSVDASLVPNKIFTTPEKIDDFIELTGGNKAAVEGLARNYTSTELANKTPAQIRSWLKTNSEWLSRFPNINKDFSDYARKLEQTGRTQTQVNKLTEQRAKMFEMGGTQTQQAESFKNMILGTGTSRDVASAAKVLGRTPEGTEAFKSSVRDLIGTLPPGSIERSYRDRIKPAMQASGLYKPDEIKFVDDAIADIVNIQNAISRASQNIGRTPGVESSAQELTRLVNREMAQVKTGGAVAGLYTAGLAALANRFNMLPELSATTGAAAGFGAAMARERYLQYVANIRNEVSKIVTDPVKLQQVLKTPKEKRQGVIASMIRQTIGSQVGAEAPERIENAPR